VLSVVWVIAMMLGPGPGVSGGFADAAKPAQVAAVKPIALGTPTRRFANTPPLVLASTTPASAASGLTVSQAIAVPANATSAQRGSQVTIVGESGRAVASLPPSASNVIVQTEQLFRAFGKGRYKNFGYTELLEPRQVGPFVGNPIFGPFGPGDGTPLPQPTLDREQLDRLKQERIYQIFPSLRPIEDRFPKPAGQ
jgi:hypothetical protein